MLSSPVLLWSIYSILQALNRIIILARKTLALAEPEMEDSLRSEKRSALKKRSTEPTLLEMSKSQEFTWDSL